MSAVVKSISGNHEEGVNMETISMPGNDCLAHAATEPLSMDVLVTKGSFFFTVVLSLCHTTEIYAILLNYDYCS